MSDQLYCICSSLEWKLGCQLSEWKAAREMAYRMGKAGDGLNQAHFDGVVKLLREHLNAFDAAVKLMGEHLDAEPSGNSR